MTKTETGKPIVRKSTEHREATFVCQHLGAGGVGLGFNRGFNPDDPDELWPMAWCDACEAELEAEGEWTDRVHGIADLWPLGVERYDVVRRRNWRQDDVAYAKLSSLARAYLERRHAELHERFPLGDRGGFSLDKPSGEIKFTGRTASILARFQSVGMLCHRDEKWTWSWASPTEPEPIKERIRTVRAYGEAHSYRQLASATWPASQADGWEMAAIAAYLLDAEGAHRIFAEDGVVFLVMNDIRWLD